jgi:hypothetical protein
VSPDSILKKYNICKSPLNRGKEKWYNLIAFNGECEIQLEQILRIEMSKRALYFC